jgi:nicotinamide mononucleotide transporter
MLETAWKTLAAQMSPLEFVAAAATLVSVYLIVKNNLWGWIWGVVSVTLYGYVFYASRLYSSVALQLLYYLPMQFVGWWHWRRGGPQRDNDLPVTTLSNRARVGWFVLALPLTALLGYAMSYTDAQMTYADAFATAMSVIGQYLMTQKRLECWAFWILVNLLYTFYLLPAQRLYVTAGLYLLLLIMAVQGWIGWKRILRQQQTIARLHETPGTASRIE